MFRLLFVSLIAAALTITAAGPADAFRAEGCGADKGCVENCTACHKLTNEEARKLLKLEKLQVTVKQVRMSPVNGIWEIEVEKDGKTGKAYLDFSKKFLIKAQFIAVEDIGKPPPLRKVDVKKIPLGDAVVMGNPKAKNKVIVFDDPDCPYCRKFHEVAKKIVEKREDVAFYLKLFPLPIHPQAYGKSKAILCNDRSLKMLEDAFAGKKLPAPDCEAKEVDANIALATELGISGTPSIIFPDGRLLPGYVEEGAFLNMLDNPQ